MSSRRPKISIPFDTQDIIMEMISITLLVLTWAYMLSLYEKLPETIPTHFNAQGVADGFGDKTFIFTIPSVATILYVGLFYLNKFPHMHSYMVNITQENAFKYYRFSTRVIRIINLLCIALFAYITYHIIQKGLGKSHFLESFFVHIIIGLSIISPIILILYMRKLNK